MAFGLFPFILFVFIAFPIAEIALLITVGEQIGLVWTLAIVIGTAILGTTLLRSQGFSVLSRVNTSMADGEMPVIPVLEGVFLLIAGAFLITPGLITDTIGFVLLVPPFRIAIAKFVIGRMLSGGGGQWSVRTWQNRPGPGSDGRRDATGGRFDVGGNVIDGEFERVDEDTLDPSKRS